MAATASLDRSQRSLGAFYTPASAAGVMADWVLRSRYDRVLEPSFGDGVFLQALRAVSSARELSDVAVVGSELASGPFGKALADGLIDPARGFQGDFLEHAPLEVDAVVGNPPYVRLRHLPTSQQQSALRAAHAALGQPMDPSGSVWMPFVLHASRFLRTGGRLALVLPFEFTHVRYARPLWAFLAERFGGLRLARVHERIFPELLQEVVVLFADDYGRCSRHVRFEAYDYLCDFLAGHPSHQIDLAVQAVIDGRREFNRALLKEDLRELLDHKLSTMMTPARGVVRFNIGYVSADKNFFHPSDRAIQDYAIPQSSLFPTLTSSRALRGFGLWTSDLREPTARLLFLPKVDDSELDPGERRYVEVGVAAGVNQRYKCRNRNPWYVVPDVRVPDAILTVFCELPLLLINDGGLTASNSFLCGSATSVSAQTLACQWYTSLTLLGLELEVHSLGGGVMVLVPREAGNVGLVRPECVPHEWERHLQCVNERLRHSDTAGAYEIGDEFVLRGGMGLSQDEIETVREGTRGLRHWRALTRGSPRTLAEKIQEEMPLFESLDHSIHEGGEA